MIKILKSVYQYIVKNIPLVPPETGGILGLDDRNIITEYFCDAGIGNNDYSYTPDIKRLNEIVCLWSCRDIKLAGIFHSHTEYDTSLSLKDIEYIKTILSSLNEITSELFFPIVFPRLKIVFFKAKMINSNVIILEEKFICI